MQYRVIDIIHGTIVDGTGLRSSVYFAGCNHRCKGCHNPESWDFGAGRAMELEEIVSEVTSEGLKVTLTGGDPAYQDLLPLLTALKERGCDIWMYTGFSWEWLLGQRREWLDYIDVVVDGEYKEDQKEDGLRFRGSLNQRIIDVKVELGKQRTCGPT